MLDTQMLDKSEDFKALRESYVIFITAEDIYKRGLPLIHIDRKIIEFDEPFGDGSHIIYVNGAYRDPETTIGRLMHDFNCRESREIYNQALRESVAHYKESEKGNSVMSEKLRILIEEEKAESDARGEAKGRVEGISIGKAEGIAIGEARGEAKGRAEGEAKGRAEGEAKGRAEGIFIGKAEGISIGEAKGRAEGQKELLFKLVTAGVLTAEEAACY